MPSTTVPNGTPKPKPKPAYVPAFTDRVIAATGPNAHARLAEVMPSLVRHLHDFAREVGLTIAEWSAAVEFVSCLFSVPPFFMPGPAPCLFSLLSCAEEGG